MSLPLSIIIPAHNEAGYIASCLGALARSDGIAGSEVIVVANGCSDATADMARGEAEALGRAGLSLSVLELPALGKIGAINAGDAAARFAARAWLDADVEVSPALMAQIAEALDVAAPRLASGTPKVMRARSWVTRAYARFWQRLPFVAAGDCPAFGLYALNAAGRARLMARGGEGLVPQVISDDTFVRLNFAPSERVQVPAAYFWPMVEGFGNLVRVRRRQDQGVAEVAALYPQLLANEAKERVGKGWLLRQVAADPLGFILYGAVVVAVRRGGKDQSGWVRGR